MKSPFSPRGHHCLCELTQASPTALNELDEVLDLLKTSLKIAGFTVLSAHGHRFPAPGSGYTAIVILAESHASIHTYPEHGYAALDVFTCGLRDPVTVARALCERLSPRGYTLRVISRGPSRSRDDKSSE